MPRFPAVCLGGTFDALHRGHRALIGEAFEVGDRVFIGVTSDALAAARRTRPVRPFVAREAAVREWLAIRGLDGRAVVAAIDHPFGRAHLAEFQAIVVSPETRATAVAVNEDRARRGLPPLEVVEVPAVLAFDGTPLSATRVAAGAVDAEGLPAGPYRVAVGSGNPVKVSAVEAVFRRAFPKADPTVVSVRVESAVGPQPVGAATVRGAVERAAKARAEADADLGVGVEAGLLEPPGFPGPLDVQVCAVVDRAGRRTLGHGAGFPHAASVVRDVLAGRDVGEVLARLSGERDIGRTKGAIGHLTHGVLDRARLTEHAVIAALVPRMNPELYGM